MTRKMKDVTRSRIVEAKTKESVNANIPIAVMRSSTCKPSASKATMTPTSPNNDLIMMVMICVKLAS